MFETFTYKTKNGKGECPVIVVGEEDGFLIVWKLIKGIILERVVPKEKIYGWLD